MKSYIISILLCLYGCLGIQADGLSIIPYPNSVKTSSGCFSITDFRLTFDTQFVKEALFLEQVLQGEFEVKKVSHAKHGTIRLEYSSQISGDESYRLLVNKEGVSIRASSSKGIFYGIQTLRQILKKQQGVFYIDYVDIEDTPAYKWRSFMLDDGRAFKGVHEIKRLLDEMALLKMNVFHWHLTDDQGWRIEIKKYPKLTEIGARRDSTQLDWYESTHFDGIPFEGYYSQEDVKDIVKYASERHITIIPEIEMPGHASAAIAAYPWLGCSGKSIKVPCAFGVQFDVFNVANPKVLNFLCDVLDEVIALFPSDIIHIGGDEVRADHWNASSEIQTFMKLNNIRNPAELQIWFTNYICNYLHSKGKRMMGWNDVTGDKLHGFQNETKIGSDFQLSSDAVVQFWVGDYELLLKAAQKGYELVNSFHEYTYLNYNHDKITPGLEYSFSPIPLEKAYSFTPVPANFPDELQKQIVGLGCQMWGEWIPTVRSMYKMIYPYWAAHAETGWTSKGNKDYTRFLHALEYFVKRWTEKGYLLDSDKCFFNTKK